jgi:hypothetical protein
MERQIPENGVIRKDLAMEGITFPEFPGKPWSMGKI